MTETTATRLCTLVPLGAQVIVKRDPPKLKTKGGILLPGDEKMKAKKVKTGIVIRKGPGNWSAAAGKRMPISDEIRPGMRVMFAQFAGNDYPHEEAHGKEVYTVFQEGELLFRIGTLEDGVPIPDGAATQESLDEAAAVEESEKRKAQEVMLEKVKEQEQALLNQAQGKSAGGIITPGGN